MGHVQFLGFVLVVHLFDRPSIDAHVPLWQQLATQAPMDALHHLLPMLKGKDHGIINGLADLKDGFRQTEAIGIQACLTYGRSIPILSNSVNQRVWLEPITIPSGSLPGAGTG